MNHNIFETIMSKTAFPVYLVEFDMCLSYWRVLPSENNFRINATYGLFSNKPDAKELCEIILQNKLDRLDGRVIDPEKSIPVSIAIKTITEYGKFEDLKKDEYTYHNGYMYQRINVPRVHIDGTPNKDVYEYKKIE